MIGAATNFVILSFLILFVSLAVLAKQSHQRNKIVRKNKVQNSKKKEKRKKVKKSKKLIENQKTPYAISVSCLL